MGLEPTQGSKQASQPASEVAVTDVLSSEIAIRVREGLVALPVRLVNVGGIGVDGLVLWQSYASIERRARPAVWVNNHEPRLPRCCWRFRGGGSHDCCDPRVVGVLTV